MRTYEKTHPWLRFSADLTEAPTKLWIMLGECQSKCVHIAEAPILPEVQKELLQVYLAKGTQATTAIEGNSLTEEDVLRHLRGELKLPPSKQYLAREIDNVVDGCNRILGLIRAGFKAGRLTVNELKILNKDVLHGLDVDDHVTPGEIRDISVGVPGYRGAPPEDCEFLLERLCDWLNSDDFSGRKGQEIVFAIIKAVLAHLYIAWIHPFGDGNGRTARLLEFRILITPGVPHPAAHLLSNHYNQTRSEYYQQLKRASQSNGDVVPFLVYAVQGFLDGLRSQIEIIQYQQWSVVWRDYVYRSFKGPQTEAAVRRRRLVLDLALEKEPIPISKLTMLTPRLARDYAGKTRKTLTRDLNILEELGLVVKEKNRVRARGEILAHFGAVTANQ